MLEYNNRWVRTWMGLFYFQLRVFSVSCNRLPDDESRMLSSIWSAIKNILYCTFVIRIAGVKPHVCEHVCGREANASVDKIQVGSNFGILLHELFWEKIHSFFKSTNSSFNFFLQIFIDTIVILGRYLTKLNKTNI